MSPPGIPLESAFFAGETCAVAAALIGNYVCKRESNGAWTWGRVVETEAYRGEDDPACHAAAGKTARNQVMYGPPGRSYVYFTYGMHHLLNAVTEPMGYPAAVLIRALDPLGGLEAMFQRRRVDSERLLTSGPARLCQALGIDLAWNDRSLREGDLLLCRGSQKPSSVASGPRIGIREGTNRNWRYWDPASRHVSRR